MTIIFEDLSIDEIFGRLIVVLECVVIHRLVSELKGVQFILSSTINSLVHRSEVVMPWGLSSNHNNCVENCSTTITHTIFQSCAS